MNENQRDTEHRPDEGKQVQQELERQLREFGDTMSDAFRHGFEGRGEEIGDRVWDVGRAAVDAANYGINAAGRAVREGQRQAEKAARAAGGSGSAWARQFFARKPEPTPVENIRASAKKRHNAGEALLAPAVTKRLISRFLRVPPTAAAEARTPVRRVPGEGARCAGPESGAHPPLIQAGPSSPRRHFSPGGSKSSAWATRGWPSTSQATSTLSFAP